jgi:hypothetical protein|tara:strand:- start:793 stop:2655 length:1863 start_codon:yes stop_codon:yes gene_type:complete
MATPIKRDVKYLNRDFSDIREKLIEFSQTYFPNTYNDFSPTSPGMMFMEQAAYVGDVMSFYLDNQLQETFTQFARQTNNLYELAYMFGYKPKATGAAQATINLYQQIPAKNLGGGNYAPDFDYALTIGENSTIASSLNSDIGFLIEDKCDFSVSSSLDPTTIQIYQVAEDIPVYYLLTKTRNSISSTINTETFSFNTPKQFQTIDITANNIIGILDIVDSDGNTWYEVDYLGQEMVFDSIKNTNPNDPNNVANNGDTPYLLQLKKVQRRFATRLSSETNLKIQFGAGDPNDTDELITPNPNNVGIGLPFEQNKLTTAYSPTNFLFTNTYGISPSNTTLTVRYLTGGGVNSNVPSGDLTTLDTTNTTFNTINLDENTANYIFGTIASTNIEAATGGKAGDTDEEIRQNTIIQTTTQQRTVTLDDYLIRSLSMPSELGIVSKAYIEKPQLDNQASTLETLCLYVLSQNSNGQLLTANDTLKKNLRTYLSQYKMIGDSIEIKDAYIINISVDFEIIVLPNFINSQVILACIESLQTYFNKDNWQMNQPILINDLYVRLDKIEGVQTVKNILFSNKAGTSLGYSQYAYDMEGATQNGVIYPSLDTSIFEIKYPNTDIKGKVVPL